MPRYPWAVRAGGPLLGGGGLPTLFDWNPETAQALPATSTFTRASVAQVLTTTDGTTNWYQQALSGEVRLDGLRRVRNFIDGAVIDSSPSGFEDVTFGSGVTPIRTDDFAADPSGEVSAVRLQMEAGGTGAGDISGIETTVGPVPNGVPDQNSMWLKLNTGTSETINITDVPGAAPKTITVTATWQRFAVDGVTAGSIAKFSLRRIGDIDGAGQIDLLMADGTAYGPQIEKIQNPGDAPGIFVNRSITYNANVVSVRYFNTTNANTVDGNAVVAEAAGVTIIGGFFLRELTAKNNMINSTDFNAASWTQDNLASVTDNGVTSLGLRQHTIIKDNALGIHRIYQVATPAETVYYIVKQTVSNPIRFVTVRHGGSSNNDFSCFDLQTGTVTENGSNSVGRITDLGDGFYKCEVTTSSQVSFSILTFSNTGTPGTADVIYTGSSEQLIVCHAQAEDTNYSTSPIITSGSTLTRVADSLTDVDWPVESSAVVDVTVDNPIALLALGMTMLGFGSGAARIFAVDAPQVLRLFNGGINSFTVPATSYEGERHSFGMSLALNDGIVVDDESNNNTDVTGTPGQGTIYIGSDSVLAGQPCRLHRVRIYDQTQSIAELEALF